jgi:hypothetical protein
MQKKVVLVLVGLVLGAALGAFATGRVRAQVPPPSPAAGTTRWEQDCEQTRNLDETRALVRSRGESGWELVALDAGVLCFKRPAPVAPRPPDPWPGY